MSVAPFIFRSDGRIPTLLAVLLVPLSVGAQVLDWSSALGEADPGDSSFTAVRAVPGDPGAGVGDTALTCGHFAGIFSFPGLAPFTSASGQDGVVVRLDRTPGPPFDWNPVWTAHLASTGGDVLVNDLVLDAAGVFYITGTYVNNVTLVGSGLSLNTGTAGATEGFVAWGDVGTGNFIDAFSVPGMDPQALVIDPAGSVYLVGNPPGALARRYQLAGGASFDWSVPPPPGLTSTVGAALTRDPTDPLLYVLSNNTNTALEVTVDQINGTNGVVNWTARAGGAGLDQAGDIAVGPDRDPRVTFSSPATTIQYESPTTITTLPALPPADLHGLVLRLAPDGEFVWSAVLGTAATPTASMTTTGLALDAFSNSFVSAGFTGAFQIESQLKNGNQDAAVAGVDAAGVLFDFHQSNGPGIEAPAAVAAPLRDLVVTVGSYRADPSNFGGQTLPVPDPGETRAFFAALARVPNQGRFIVTPNPGDPAAPSIPELIDELHQLGGQIYEIVGPAGNELRVAAFLTDDLAANLAADPRLLIEQDVPLFPAGSSADAGWALNHLNDATNGVATTYSYTCPDTALPVNVYLLDTAVDTSSGWFGGNVNLGIEATTLVRGFGDPLNSTTFQHGTEMLSLLAGPDTGVALGTAVTVKNFDFYPAGIPSTASLLADAIYQAIDYHLDFGDCNPGLIVIASSGASLGSPTVSGAVGEAIAEGIPVIVSAGNANADAAGFIPASSGTTSGVVCVGASTQARAKEAGSNHTTIDLSAPGEAVRVIDFAAPNGGGYGSFTGTSASAALAAGAAAVHLSVNPWSTPAELETALAADTYPEGGSGLSILQLPATGPAFSLDYDAWTAWHKLADVTHAGDEDGDGWNNLDEYFHGLKPTKFDPKGAQATISYDAITGKYSYRFHIATALLDQASLGSLRDGGSYEVTHSMTGTGFTTAPGTLTVGSSTGLQTELLLENTVVDPKCFLQLDVSPASPSP